MALLEKSSVPPILTMSNIRSMDITELEIDLIPSPHDPAAGAHIGVRIRHKILSLKVESTSQRTQHANRLDAMKLLKERLIGIDGAGFDSKTFK